jgi:hypothetical protein
MPQESYYSQHAQCIEPIQCVEFNANKDSVGALDAFAYLNLVEYIADFQDQASPPPLRRTETYPAASTPLSDFITELRKREAHSCLGQPNNTIPRTRLRHIIVQIYPVWDQEEGYKDIL